ncbi:MAG: hypothetical protein EXR59_04805 [Dehalococcoidia bacterium]|nr:hypothetical protein [Dehalococcoidia bacterium]
MSISTSRSRISVTFAALFIVLTPLAQPRTVAAKQGPSPFTISATLCLVGLPTIKVVPRAPGLIVDAKGEQLGGAISESSWSELAGAGVNAVIAHEESIFNLVANTFEGKIKGKIKIARPEEVMQGSINGTVSGAFLPIANPADLLSSIYTSTANVKWNIQNNGSESDDEDNSRARGTASVTFVADPNTGTYCGPIVLNGWNV